MRIERTYSKCPKCGKMEYIGSGVDCVKCENPVQTPWEMLHDASREISELSMLATNIEQRAIEAENKVSRLRAQLADLEDENEKIRNVLMRHGFSRCTSPVCNCDSWHHTEGLAARWEELESDLADAGFPLNNDNGHILRKALGAALAKLADAKATISRWEEITRDELACTMQLIDAAGVRSRVEAGEAVQAVLLDVLRKARPVPSNAGVALGMPGAEQV